MTDVMDYASLGVGVAAARAVPYCRIPSALQLIPSPGLQDPGDPTANRRRQSQVTKCVFTKPTALSGSLRKSALAL